MIALGLVASAGGLTFLAGAMGDQPLWAWQAYLVNFLFWSGIAQAGPVFATIHEMTGARWGRPIRRIAEGMAAFLPISFGLFLGLVFGRGAIFPWARQPIPAKQAWLNLPFLLTRDAAALFLLGGLSLGFLYWTLRPDVESAREDAPAWARPLHRLLRAGWRGRPAELARSRRALAVLAPLLAIAYCLGFTLLAFDLVMALDPQWSSTLFGAYFFMGNLYAGLASLVLLAALARRGFRLEALFPPRQFHDLGKLLLAFCLLTGDFFWSQFLVIWYGNLPEETGFVLARVARAPWAPLSWAVLLVCFLGAFVVLLSRRIKERPSRLCAVAVAILGGMWLERFLLVVPSLWPGTSLPLGVPELLITASFAALFLLALLAFARAFPLLPRSAESAEAA
jgi:Ni/Fe-hydrogenase subunit HybB-like protein